MKQEWKDKWTAALRSGEYKQGRGKLRNFDNTYCCLGVLCDIVRPGKWKEGVRSYLTIDDDGYQLTSQWLTSDIIETTGFEPFNQGMLANMNDRGIPFNQIADFIEENC
jgi:hypothetical protein